MKRLIRFHIVFLLAVLIAGFIGCKTQESAVAGKGNAGSKTRLNEKELRDFTVKFMDANTAKILGDYEEALWLFRESLEIDPSSAAAKYEIGRIYANKNDLSTAVNYVKEAFELEPDNIWYANVYGKILAELGNMDESIAIFQHIIKTHPDNYSYYLSLGSLLSAQGRYDEALKLYDQLENKAGMSENLAMQRQMIYLDMGNYDAALNELDKLLATNPEEIRFYGMKAEIYQEQGRDDEALKLYEQMLEMDPENGLVLLSLHDLEKAKKQEEKAREYLTRAMDATDLSIDVKVNILLSFLNSSKLKSDRDYIVSLAEAVEATHPDEAKTYAVFGDIYFNLDEYENAREKFRKAVAIDPNRPPIWQQILAIDSQLNDFDNLLEESEEAIDYFPHQPIFYLFNGIAHLQKKQTDEAIEALTAGKNLVIENNSLLAQFHASLGDAYHAKKNHDKSDQSYEMALKLDPKNVIVLNNYAYYLSLRQLNLEKAESMAKKANDLSPDVASFQDTYGWVLFMRKNYQNALFWIEESLKNGGDSDPVVLDHHGDVLFKLNRKEEAIQSWQKAIEKGGEPDEINPKIEQAKTQ